MNIALILAGGTGSRLGGDVPKQYLNLNECPIISYCLDTFENHAKVDVIQIVAEQRWQNFIQKWTGKKMRGFSRPGVTRQLSIWNGIQDIMKYARDEDRVIIHDAARPFVSEDIIDACLDACEIHDGALPVLPMKDTVYLGEEGRIISLLERQKVYAGQAPEAFRLDKYYEANKRLLPEKILMINGSTEPAIMAGMDIALVPGDERNLKITTKEDLIQVERMLVKRT